MNLVPGACISYLVLVSFPCDHFLLNDCKLSKWSMTLVLKGKSEIDVLLHLHEHIFCAVDKISIILHVPVAMELSNFFLKNFDCIFLNIFISFFMLCMFVKDVFICFY